MTRARMEAFRLGDGGIRRHHPSPSWAGDESPQRNRVVRPCSHSFLFFFSLCPEFRLAGRESLLGTHIITSCRHAKACYRWDPVGRIYMWFLGSR